MQPDRFMALWSDETDLKRVIVTAALVIELLSIAACGPSDSDFVEFDTFDAPDEQHRIVIEIAPENSFAYSPEAIRFYLARQDTSERHLLATTNLANDGSKLTDENIRAEWVDSRTLKICLSGAEQHDQAVVIDVVTASFSIASAKCVGLGSIE